MPQSKTQQVRRSLAFTLLELLTVIAILGILAALSLPVLKNFQPNYRATATRQLLDDLARARQLAISERTTVLMVFVRTNFWQELDGTIGAANRWSPADWRVATNLFEKQLIGYNFVSLRSLGDQPGVHTPRYLSSWKTLPEGAFISVLKFALPPNSSFTIFTNSPAGVPVRGFDLYGFNWTTDVPFPRLDTPMLNQNANRQHYVWIPYIAFNYLGQLCDENGNALQRNAVFSLAKGSVGVARDPVTRLPRELTATVNESPPGNATNSLSYNVVVVDWLTGRARAFEQEIR
jgi:prepilin-type N-terminal cleavage/methylation domain-containing protein